MLIPPAALSRVQKDYSSHDAWRQRLRNETGCEIGSLEEVRRCFADFQIRHDRHACKRRPAPSSPSERPNQPQNFQEVNAAGAAWDCPRGLSPESSSSSSASFELDFSSPPRGPDYSPLIIPCPGSSGQSSLHSPSLENTAGSPLVLSPPRNYTASPLSLTTSPLGLTASPLRLRTSPPALTASPLGRSTSPLGLRTSPLGLTTSPLGLTTSPLGLTTSALGLALSVSPASQPCRSPAFESCARPASPMEDARSFLTRTFFSDEEHPASTSGTGLVGHSRFLGASEPASTWGPRRSPPQVGWVDVASQRPPPRLDCDLAQGIERTTRSLNASFGRVSSVRFADDLAAHAEPSTSRAQPGAFSGDRRPGRYPSHTSRPDPDDHWHYVRRSMF
ncbi:uncharacterized protein ISCGN_031807 [Ixodes scapularis]